ncbi:DsbA family protein [Ignatzschineria rhizosphaerae]|uniref:DsbA family protein n=1 Tax=Ignatzschineria rhizosphaerae TaxID=2923279 RepID=A0ABY3X5M5_9GAMM|nr:DsbA family protein [Ignatzschineria rhizosphaerae]UNM97054.1 DsbA family protein [Ignatzschineria rhizosphaerae]
MSQLNCQDGICEVPESQEPVTKVVKLQNKKIIYVGDPMCSWCYGIAPVVAGLQEYCDANALGFEIVVGGLRSGGGDQWNSQFKDFLRHEWQKIEETTGQPFAFKLLDLEYFNYDTEPSCRAVVTAKSLLPDDNQKLLTQFFAAVQQKFYLENEDPKETIFYQGICEMLQLDFKQFKEHFESAEMKQKTIEEFHYRSLLGVRGFPSFVMIKDHEAALLTSGYTSLQSLIRKIETR